MIQGVMPMLYNNNNNNGSNSRSISNYHIGTPVAHNKNIAHRSDNEDVNISSRDDSNSMSSDSSAPPTASMIITGNEIAVNINTSPRSHSTKGHINNTNPYSPRSSSCATAGSSSLHSAGSISDSTTNNQQMEQHNTSTATCNNYSIAFRSFLRLRGMIQHAQKGSDLLLLGYNQDGDDDDRDNYDTRSTTSASTAATTTATEQEIITIPQQRAGSVNRIISTIGGRPIPAPKIRDEGHDSDTSDYAPSCNNKRNNRKNLPRIIPELLSESFSSASTALSSRSLEGPYTLEWMYFQLDQKCQTLLISESESYKAEQKRSSLSGGQEGHAISLEPNEEPQVVREVALTGAIEVVPSKIKVDNATNKGRPEEIFAFSIVTDTDIITVVCPNEYQLDVWYNVLSFISAKNKQVAQQQQQSSRPVSRSSFIRPRSSLSTHTVTSSSSPVPTRPSSTLSVRGNDNNNNPRLSPTVEKSLLLQQHQHAQEEVAQLKRKVADLERRLAEQSKLIDTLLTENKTLIETKHHKDQTISQLLKEARKQETDELTKSRSVESDMNHMKREIVLLESIVKKKDATLQEMSEIIMDLLCQQQCMMGYKDGIATEEEEEEEDGDQHKRSQRHHQQQQHRGASSVQDQDYDASDE